MAPYLNTVRGFKMKRQSGMTLISWLIVGVFLLFQIVIAMQVIPVYLTDSSVKTMMEGLSGDVALRGTPAKKMKQIVMKRLSVNSVYDIKPDNIKIKKTRDGKVIVIDYEPRGKLFGDLEFIVSFHHEAIIPSGKN